MQTVQADGQIIDHSTQDEVENAIWSEIHGNQFYLAEQYLAAKRLTDAESVYQQVRQALEQGQPRLLEMTCEKVEGKRLSVLTSDVLAVQIYEKTAASGGSKRPGFSLDS